MAARVRLAGVGMSSKDTRPFDGAGPVRLNVIFVAVNVREDLTAARLCVSRPTRPAYRLQLTEVPHALFGGSLRRSEILDDRDARLFVSAGESL